MEPTGEDYRKAIEELRKRNYALSTLRWIEDEADQVAKRRMAKQGAMDELCKEQA